VHAAVRRRIGECAGWIGFDEYLELVLYAPGLGYYSAGAEKFGASGDFVTAPEISPLFGACIARQCVPLLGADRDLLELGAGSGALAAVLLTRLADAGALPGHYFILEVSADLRERQRARLARLPPGLYERVHWLDTMPARALRGVILANEVADALPFQCFSVSEGGYNERGVGLDAAGNLCWAERPATVILREELQRIERSLKRSFAPGYQSEVCMRAAPWVEGLAAVLESGCILLIDYGLGRPELYHPQRHRGTLRCQFRHRWHEDPFLYPGVQDISAWVDYTRIAEAASAAGLEVAGYCTQAAFLIGAGIEAELSAGRSMIEGARAAQQARTLLMPGEMGESCKAMLLARGAVPDMPAFCVQDLRRLL
jgi:SAM-dependent MidA family methyltransferase